jgi:hypothetical protein
MVAGKIILLDEDAVMTSQESVALDADDEVVVLDDVAGRTQHGYGEDSERDVAKADRAQKSE